MTTTTEDKKASFILRKVIIKIFCRVKCRWKKTSFVNVSSWGAVKRGRIKAASYIIFLPFIEWLSCSTLWLYAHSSTFAKIICSSEQWLTLLLAQTPPLLDKRPGTSCSNLSPIQSNMNGVVQRACCDPESNTHNQKESLTCSCHCHGEDNFLITCMYR